VEGEKRSGVIAATRDFNEYDGRKGHTNDRGIARCCSRHLREREAIEAEIADLVLRVLGALGKSGGMRRLPRRRRNVRNRVSERCLLTPQEAKHQQCVDE